MNSRLLKIELKSAFRKLWILYAGALVCALPIWLFNITFPVLFTLLVFGAVAFCAAFLLIGMLILWQELIHCLFDARSSLIRTLPVSLKTLFSTSCISALIVTAVNLLIVLAVLILVFMPSGLDFTILPEEVRSVLMWLIPGGYLQLVFIWLCGVFGLVTSKGNASSRILSAAGRGILIYFILEIVMVLIAFGFLIASQTLSLDMVVGEADISFESMKTLLIFICNFRCASNSCPGHRQHLAGF